MNAEQTHNAGICEHYVVKYDCEHTEREKTSCISAEFCIGGVCKEQERSTNKHFGKAISGLNVLSHVKTDGEGCGCVGEQCKTTEVSACKLFKGVARRCLKNIQYNCCFDKGIIKKMIGCSDEAKDLQEKNKAKLCVFTGGWRTRINKIWSRAQSYCCFNSRLARIIQTAGRRQLGIGWGDGKNPDCRPLTLAEMQRIDFSKIDFSELYDELKQKATQDFAKAKENMISRKFQSTNFSGGINNKLKKFYEK